MEGKLIEIVASVAGALLTALVAFIAYRYRSLIVTDVVRIRANLKVDAGRVVPGQARDFMTSQEVDCYHLTLENKGWKGVTNATFHASGLGEAFSITKKSKGISKESISVSENDGSLEIGVSYFPRGEKIEINLATFNSRSFHEIRGAGPSYKCESSAYYLGFQGGFRIIVNFVAIAGFAFFIASMASSMWNDLSNSSASAQQLPHASPSTGH